MATKVSNMACLMDRLLANSWLVERRLSSAAQIRQVTKMKIVLVLGSLSDRRRVFSPATFISVLCMVHQYLYQ